MLDPFDICESMDLVAFLGQKRKTVPVGGNNKFFFSWDRDRQNEYLTSLFSRANRAGSWMFMDTGGIPETIKKEDYDFVINRLGELSKK